jgi:RNA polymerase nonessential primary-like sigma factor
MKPKTMPQQLTIRQRWLVAKNLGLAYTLANRYFKKSFYRGRANDDLDQLTSWAYDGLIRAAVYYRPERGFAFSTYAWWAIGRTIHQQAQLAQPIWLPRHKLQKGSRSRLGKHAKILASEQRPFTVRDKKGDDQGWDVATYDKVPNFDEVAQLRQAVKALPPRWRQIIEKRYGLNGYHPHTQPTIGRHMHLCKERIRQLEDMALMFIRLYVGRRVKTWRQFAAIKKTARQNDGLNGYSDYISTSGVLSAS